MSRNDTEQKGVYYKKNTAYIAKAVIGISTLGDNRKQAQSWRMLSRCPLTSLRVIAQSITDAIPRVDAIKVLGMTIKSNGANRETIAKLTWKI